jgi:hypothetical protein
MLKTKPAAAKAAPVAEAAEPQIHTVSVSRKFTYAPSGAADYESMSIQSTVTADDYETAAAHLEEIMLAEAEKANVQFSEVARSANAVAADLDDGMTTGEEGVDDTGTGADEGEITAEHVKAMKRSEIVALIEANGLATKPDDYPKIGDLKAAVIEEAFGAEDDAGTEGGEAGDAGGEEQVGPEQIQAMNRGEILALCKENNIEIDETDYAKTPVGLKRLRDDVVAVAFAEEDDAAAAEDPNAVAEYTEAELNASSIDDLKMIYTTWELGKFPAGVPKVAKAAAVKAIL